MIRRRRRSRPATVRDAASPCLDAQRLDAQIDRYRGEMRATQLRLDAELEIPAGEEQALAEFAHQLQKHVSRLRERADAKRAEAAALRGSDEDGDQLERDAEDLP